MKRTIIVSILSVLALVACSDEGPVAGPGTLTATLTGPNGAEGAAVLRLIGDGIGDVSPIGTTEIHARESPGRLQIVLLDRDGGTLSFRVAVADTTQPPAPVVLQVAGPDDELRTSADAYTVEFSR